jgi:hypothetical protein
MTNASRRTFLIGTGALLAAAPATAQATAADDQRFTVAVIPDTQYLFDSDRGDSAPLDASLRYIVEHTDDIAFVAHLGDLTEHGTKDEIEGISRSFRALDRRRVGYSVLAGNHDIDQRTDDQRGRTPYLDAFGPQRFRTSPTFRGATADGYNSYHVFRAAGREWLVLALDWRPSSDGIAWARDVLKQHPAVPTILTTHELVHADDSGQADFSAFGRVLWEGLIRDNDQIFLTLNGHYWPPGRTVLRNDAGHDVHVHITNYQDRYYGGSAMIRLYEFDLARNTIDVSTISPWLQGKRELNTLERGEVERTGPADRFSVPIDFKQRFGHTAPVPRPAREVLIPGTVAYWRFDQPSFLRDLSGNGNDLKQIGTLDVTAEHHDNQPGHGSLYFGKAGHLSTVDNAPVNGQTFKRGYTIETFIKLPKDFNHAWCGLFTKLAPGSAAGKTGDDPQEPIATLNLSDGAGLQWAVFPTNRDAISTNWGHELPHDRWWHVAVVNDGRHTKLYVEGSELLRNPSTPAIGISTANDPWLVGAYAYNKVVEKSYHGWLGDFRIVDRALPVDKFMLGR